MWRHFPHPWCIEVWNFYTYKNFLHRYYGGIGDKYQVCSGSVHIMKSPPLFFLFDLAAADSQVIHSNDCSPQPGFQDFIFWENFHFLRFNCKIATLTLQVILLSNAGKMKILTQWKLETWIRIIRVIQVMSPRCH